MMDRFSEKQLEISRRRADAVSRYPELWSKIIAEWNLPGTEDRVWLTYSANYLFRTNNMRWAIDPLTLSWRIRDAPKVDVAGDLKNLSFVLLTHCHGDYLDLDLISALRHVPIIWVVPEPVLAIVINETGLPHERIITPSPFQPIELDGLQILPFDGLHWETNADGTRRGVPATGYLIEVNRKCWLFPGDTRTYDARRLPGFGAVDHLFAHLWLGCGCALMDEPPRMGSFCQFCVDLKPSHIIMTHLDEFGRDANDLWDQSHAQKVCSRLRRITPDARVIYARMGESISLQNTWDKVICQTHSSSN